eukprot:1765641-Rhodomonas_salina.5
MSRTSCSAAHAEDGRDDVTLKILVVVHALEGVGEHLQRLIEQRKLVLVQPSPDQERAARSGCGCGQEPARRDHLGSCRGAALALSSCKFCVSSPLLVQNR